MFVLDALIAIHIPRVDWIKVKEVEGSLLGDKAQRWVQGGGGERECKAGRTPCICLYAKNLRH